MYRIIILCFFLFLLFSFARCSKKINPFESALPVRHTYSKKITNILSKRQKKYYQNIASTINQEGGYMFLAAVASLKNGKVSDDFLDFQSSYVRFSKYETAENRQTLLTANEKILKGARAMNLIPVEVAWSPVASPGFAAFTTPLPLLNSSFSDGALIEISNAIEDNLTNMSHILLNLAAETSERFEGNSFNQYIKYRSKEQIDSVFSEAKYFQHYFNASLLEYFFHENGIGLVDSTWSLMSGTFLAQEALFFICSHEYAHVMLNHIQTLKPLRFSSDTTNIKSKNTVNIGEVSISNEFSADSLGLLLCKQDTYGFIEPAAALAIIWLDITERIQAAKYNHVVYLTHPPAKDRYIALSQQMKNLGMNDKTFESFFYCYELLWEDFESVMQDRLNSN